MSMRLLHAIILVFVLAAVAASTRASAARPLVTAVSYTGVEGEFRASDTNLALRRIRASGATAFRSTLYWWWTAPHDPKRGFNAVNHRDSGYDWSLIDDELRRVVANGLTPIVAIFGTPRWARLQPSRVDSAPRVADFAAFARAAAARYSGRVRGLPRVRYWQVWLEPNLSSKLRPQLDNGRFVGPAIYRRMVNAFSGAVDSVHRDNVVIAGGTGPFSDHDPEVQAVTKTWGPLAFMRDFLCLSKTLKPTCNERVRFDIWAHHPYTSGGPLHRADKPDDVSLGDLPRMKRTLDAAVRSRHIVSSRKVGFWVTEFSWDSNPPDDHAVPTRLHVRWVAEGLYRMWQNGISLVTWLQLRDHPINRYEQSGLYYRGRTIRSDRPKPALRAFRFPFVAFPKGRGVLVWGRTPAGRRASVLVEQTFKGGWKQLGVVRTNGAGIFRTRFPGSPQGLVRARTVDRNEAAVPFSLARVRDRFYNPFGYVKLCGFVLCPRPPKR